MRKRVATVLIGLVLSVFTATSASAALSNVSYETFVARNARTFKAYTFLTGEAKGSCKVQVTGIRDGGELISHTFTLDKWTGEFETSWAGLVTILTVEASNCKPLK